MDYKPGDFFLGIIDFFGVLVPGAVLLFLQGEWLPQAIGLRLEHDSVAMWAAFFVGSYVVGQFLLGAGVPLNRLLRVYAPESKDRFYNEVKDAIKLPPGAGAGRIEEKTLSIEHIPLCGSAIAHLPWQKSSARWPTTSYFEV